MMKSYSWSAWHELKGKCINPDGKNDIVLSGETIIEKVVELFYLDQLGSRINKHYDTKKNHCKSIKEYMKIETICV